MNKRPKAFLEFARHFFRYSLFVHQVLVGLLLLLLLAGFVFSRLEDIPLGDALYFTFITGLSIGYGDITPKTGLGSVVSIGIGMIGMIFTGMTVAVATRALADSIKEYEKNVSQ